MPNDFKMINSERIELTDAEQADWDAHRERIRTVERPARLFDLLRMNRNRLLSETDYLFGSDAPSMTAEKINEWKVWRQRLRDLPANTDNPQNVTWPDKPT